MDQETVRLNFEFPRDQYPYLKMLLADRRTSLKEFATQVLIEAIEEYEDELLAQKASQRLSEMDEQQNIDFDEACKLAGWKDDKEV